MKHGVFDGFDFLTHAFGTPTKCVRRFSCRAVSILLILSPKQINSKTNQTSTIMTNPYAAKLDFAGGTVSLVEGIVIN